MDITEVIGILDNMYNAATKIKQIDDPIVWALYQTYILAGGNNKNKKVDCETSNYEIVQQWKINHPQGRKTNCSRETGLSRPTVDKYWE